MNDVALLEAVAVAAAFAEVPPVKARPRARCRIAGHGELVRRSDAMGDYYCADCRAVWVGSYLLGATPGRRLVRAEAARRGGCQFVLIVGAAEMRCAARFEDGGLHWHHRDPASKIATVSSLATGSNLVVLTAELAKCDLLCRGHHRVAQRVPPEGQEGGNGWRILRP